MINIFRRLTAKEWGMIALSTVFICLAVWMDLKTPEYLSDITTLLAKEGFGYYGSGKQDVALLFWKLFNGSFCRLFGFKSRCQLYDATSRRDFPSSDGLL